MRTRAKSEGPTRKSGPSIARTRQSLQTKIKIDIASDEAVAPKTRKSRLLPEKNSISNTSAVKKSRATRRNQPRTSKNQSQSLSSNTTPTESLKATIRKSTRVSKSNGQPKLVVRKRISSKKLIPPEPPMAANSSRRKSNRISVNPNSNNVRSRDSGEAEVKSCSSRIIRTSPRSLASDGSINLQGKEASGSRGRGRKRTAKVPSDQTKKSVNSEPREEGSIFKSCDEADRNTHKRLPHVDPSFVKKYGLKTTVVHLHPTIPLPTRRTRTRMHIQINKKQDLPTSDEHRKQVLEQTPGSRDKTKPKRTRRSPKKSVGAADHNTPETAKAPHQNGCGFGKTGRKNSTKPSAVSEDSFSTDKRIQLPEPADTSIVEPSKPVRGRPRRKQLTVPNDPNSSVLTSEAEEPVEPVDDSILEPSKPARGRRKNSTVPNTLNSSVFSAKTDEPNKEKQSHSVERNDQTACVVPVKRGRKKSAEPDVVSEDGTITTMKRARYQSPERADAKTLEIAKADGGRAKSSTDETLDEHVPKKRGRPRKILKSNASNVLHQTDEPAELETCPSDSTSLTVEASPTNPPERGVIQLDSQPKSEKGKNKTEVDALSSTAAKSSNTSLVESVPDSTETFLPSPEKSDKATLEPQLEGKAGEKVESNELSLAKILPHKGKKQVTYVPPPKVQPAPEFQLETLPITGGDWEFTPEAQAVALEYYNSKRESESPTTSKTTCSMPPSKSSVEPRFRSTESFQKYFFDHIHKNTSKPGPVQSLVSSPCKSKPSGTSTPTKSVGSVKPLDTPAPKTTAGLSKSDSTLLNKGKLTAARNINFSTPTKSVSPLTTFSTPPTGNRPSGSFGSSPVSPNTSSKPVFVVKQTPTKPKNTLGSCLILPDNFDDDDDDLELLDLEDTYSPIPSFEPRRTPSLPPSQRSPEKTSPNATVGTSPRKSIPGKSGTADPVTLNQKSDIDKGVVDLSDDDILKEVGPSKSTDTTQIKLQKNIFEVEDSDDDDDFIIEEEEEDLKPRHKNLKQKRLDERRREEIEAPSVFSHEIHPLRSFPSLCKLGNPEYMEPTWTEEEMRNSVTMSKFVTPRNADDNPAKTARDKAAKEIIAFAKKLKSVKDGTYREEPEPEISTRRTQRVQINKIYKVKQIGPDGKLEELCEHKSMEDKDKKNKKK